MQIRVAVADAPGRPLPGRGRRLTAEAVRHRPARLRGRRRRALAVLRHRLPRAHARRHRHSRRPHARPIHSRGQPRPVTRARYDWQVYDPTRREGRRPLAHGRGPVRAQAQGRLLPDVQRGQLEERDLRRVSYAIDLATSSRPKSGRSMRTASGCCRSCARYRGGSSGRATTRRARARTTGSSSASTIAGRPTRSDRVLCDRPAGLGRRADARARAQRRAAAGAAAAHPRGPPGCRRGGRPARARLPPALDGAPGLPATAGARAAGKWHCGVDLPRGARAVRAD